MTILTRLLLAALAGTCIGLAKKALEHHEQSQTSLPNQAIASTPALLRPAGARPGAARPAWVSQHRSFAPLPMQPATFYQQGHWLYVPCPAQPVGPR